MTVIHELEPELNKRRIRRAIKRIIRELAAGIFALATSGSVDVLRRHINVLSQRFSEIANTVAKEEGDLASMMSLVDERFENIYGFVNETRQLAHNILIRLHDSERKHKLIEEMILNQTEQAARVRSRLSKLSIAISK